MVADHLRAESFQTISPGISAIKTITSSGIGLIALRIKPEGLRFRLIKQTNPKGDWVDDLGTQNNAEIAFNGGFFSINKKGHKVPVGLLTIKDRRYSQPWKRSGGYLEFQDGKLTISQTLGRKVPKGENVLQTKPVLIEPGGIWAMNTNKVKLKKRMMVCIDGAGEIIVVAIIGGGLSLFEAGWLMRDEKVGGVFNCDSAIAMDGGGSTQIWIRDRPDLSFGGETPVHNAVIISAAITGSVESSGVRDLSLISASSVSPCLFGCHDLPGFFVGRVMPEHHAAVAASARSRYRGQCGVI